MRRGKGKGQPGQDGHVCRRIARIATPEAKPWTMRGPTGTGHLGLGFHSDWLSLSLYLRVRVQFFSPHIARADDFRLWLA